MSRSEFIATTAALILVEGQFLAAGQQDLAIQTATDLADKLEAVGAAPWVIEAAQRAERTR